MNPVVIGPISIGRPASILEQAEQCLDDDGRLRLHSVSCAFHQGILTLSGRVPTYYVKQLAQEVLRAIDSVECIANELEVELAVRSAGGHYDGRD